MIFKYIIYWHSLWVNTDSHKLAGTFVVTSDSIRYYTVSGYKQSNILYKDKCLYMLGDGTLMMLNKSKVTYQSGSLIYRVKVRRISPPCLCY